MFFEQLFQKSTQKSILEQKNLLKDIPLPVLNQNQQSFCEQDITEKDLYNSLKEIPNNKSPGNDGLTKEFYEAFWDELKTLFIRSFEQAKTSKQLSISQRQAIIMVLSKKDKDKLICIRKRVTMFLS